MPSDVRARRGLVLPTLPDTDAAGRHVVNQRPLHAAVLAAAAKPDGITAQMGNFAILERYVPCAVHGNCRRHAHCRLGVAVSFGRQGVLVVLKTQSLENDVFDIFAALRVAGQPHQSAEHRSDDFHLRRCFSRPWHVKQITASVQEPLTGRIEGGFDILNVIALVRPPSVERVSRIARQRNHASLRIDGGHPQRRD